MSLGLGLLIIGGLLAVLVGWLVNRSVSDERFSWIGLVIGALAFLIAGVVQNLLVTPVAISIHGVEGLAHLVPIFIWEALYYGFAAGVAQEGMKFLANFVYKRRGYIPVAIALGAGFALAEIVFISLSAWQSPVVAFSGLTIPVWERFSAILFHIGTAMIIGYGLVRQQAWRYFFLAILLHTVLDGVVGLMGMYEMNQVILFESVFFVCSVIILWLAFRWAKKYV